MLTSSLESAHIGMVRLKWIGTLIEKQVSSVNLIGIAVLSVSQKC